MQIDLLISKEPYLKSIHEAEVFNDFFLNRLCLVQNRLGRKANSQAPKSSIKAPMDPTLKTESGRNCHPQAWGEIATHPPFSHPSTRAGSRKAADTGRWELCGEGNMDEEQNTLKSSQHGSH